MKYAIGIDEVGRGPIAGPVAVCAFACAITNYELLIKNGEKETKIKLKDSKKLSKKQREKWFSYLQKCQKEGKCDFKVSYVSPENIDKFGIVKCIQKALDQSLSKVVATQEKQNLRALPSLRGLRCDSDFASPAPLDSFSVFLDGGLKAPKEYVNQETIVKGDELHPIISCASIVAKVSRDKIMANYAKEFQEYGFENHSGYGTVAHYKAIKKHGLTVLHRKTFIRSEK